MNRLTLWIVLALIVFPVHAQLAAPVRTLAPITDPLMVVIDRGSRLEVFPNKRAIPLIDSASGAETHRVVTASADAAVGPQQLGVVFNHATQQQGYITGEITFKMKAGHTAQAFSRSQYPGLKKITNPEVYVVNATTPGEFLRLLKRLQAHSDLEWVEPTVTYGAGHTHGITQ